MSIVPMQRVTLVGLASDKVAVLDALQGLGALHLIPLGAPDPLEPLDPADRRRADTAFRHLADAPEKLRPYPAGAAFDRDAVIAEVIANRLKLRKLHDREAELDALIDGLEPWGDFALPPEALGGQHLWLYALPVRDRAVLARLEQPWAIVGHRPTALLVAVVAPEAPPPDLLPVPRTDPGGKPLAALRAEREDLAITVEKAERARADLTRWRLRLGADLAAAEDADDRRAAGGLTRDTEGVFAVQGWAPVRASAALAALAEARGLALVIEPPAPGEVPPTLLEAPDPRLASGPDLTSFYTSPGYNGWDPSLVVFVSFAIFFAMIMADAGYPLLLGLGLTFYWRRLGASVTGRRLRALVAAILGTAFAYGVAAGSYFGVAPPPDSLPGRLAFIDVTDFEAMMRVSIVIGALHIGVALGVVAWLNRGTPRGIAPLGWIAVILGGLIFWLGASEGAGTVGILFIVAGLAAVFWGSGAARQITKPSDWLLRLTDGLLGLTGVTKLFGDLLSYLRLFALGLASASLAATFNTIAGEIMAARPGLGVLFAILVLVFGHAINLVIGIMSGVVHGLRLNYIEFFGWGLTEEGYPFRAFAKREAPA